MEDEKIIELFFERSENAIIELAKKYGRLCTRISYNILHDNEDTEECVNDAYYVVWNKVPPERPDPFRTYLLRIVKNISIKKFRYRRAMKRNCEYEMSLEELGECISHGNVVEEEIALKELTAHIEDFLNILSEEDRVMFVKRYWFVEAVKDIAEEFGITQRNASMRLTRIRKKLKTYLDERGIKI